MPTGSVNGLIYNGYMTRNWFIYSVHNKHFTKPFSDPTHTPSA